MSTYARIADGVVAELFTPPEGVAIEECFHPDLTWVDCSATADVAPGWIYDGSTFSAPPPPPPPTLQEQAAAALLTSMQVVCTSIPALDGAYPINRDARDNITGIAAAINAGLGLPGGGETFNWPDAAGVPHAWPATQFTAFGQGGDELCLCVVAARRWRAWIAADAASDHSLMTAFSGFFAVGGAIEDGVLTEPLPETGYARQAVAGDVSADAVVTLPSGLTFGPFAAGAGPFGACGIFDQADGGTLLYSAALAALSVPAGGFLTFPAGQYAMTPGSAPAGNVLTINGQPLTFSGAPLSIG